MLHLCSDASTPTALRAVNLFNIPTGTVLALTVIYYSCTGTEKKYAGQSRGARRLMLTDRNPS